MSSVTVVRRARPSDESARADLIRRGVASHQFDAFLLFFFQELTLQWCVLGGAVLFIFCGASAAACALLAPAAAAAAALAVSTKHRALADNQVQNMRREVMGFVCEYRGPPVNDPRRVCTRLVDEKAAEAEGAGEGEGGREGRVVGTVSVSDCHGPGGGGWMHALATHPQWQRRGVGGALAAAARGGAAARGHRTLSCVLAELQPRARRLLHRAGWGARGWYHRRVCGSALTLQLTHFVTDTHA